MLLSYRLNDKKQWLKGKWLKLSCRCRTALLIMVSSCRASSVLVLWPSSPVGRHLWVMRTWQAFLGHSLQEHTALWETTGYFVLFFKHLRWGWKCTLNLLNSKPAVTTLSTQNMLFDFIGPPVYWSLYYCFLWGCVTLLISLIWFRFYCPSC